MAFRPFPSVFHLLTGPRYNGDGAFDVTTLQMPPDYSRLLEDNVETVPLGLSEHAVVIDLSAVYGLPEFKDIGGQLATVSARPRVKIRR